MSAPVSGKEETRRAPVSAADAARRKAIFGGGGLYAPRQPIHPKLVHGRWRQIKWAMLIITLGIYYGAPWLRWDRPGDLPDQAILIDFTGGRTYFFFLQFWPQEVVYITGMLVIAALGLFLVTALFGRLWCGYSCPQTIWTDLYILVERAFEGDRNARMRLDAAPWTANKVARRGGKHIVWLLIAFWTGGAWNLYFHDAPTLVMDFWAGTAPLTAYVSFAVLTLTTYSLAGLMREQVCTYMCPWPRIQAALTDVNTLQVTYRRDRGEPRGAHKKGQDWKGRGDCIDCRQCVVVCPMGIDIRDGLQLECINCGLCADACDEIMDKIDRPRGLIGYDSEAAIAAREARQPAVYRLVRPRTLLYAALLVLVTGIVATALVLRQPAAFSVERDRNPTFVTLSDGSVRDGFSFKLTNRAFETRTFEITVEGLEAAEFRTPADRTPRRSLSVVVPANTSVTVRASLTVPPSDTRPAIQPIVFNARTGPHLIADKSAFVSGVAND